MLSRHSLYMIIVEENGGMYENETKCEEMRSMKTTEKRLRLFSFCL